MARTSLTRTDLADASIAESNEKPRPCKGSGDAISMKLVLFLAKGPYSTVRSAPVAECRDKVEVIKEVDHRIAIEISDGHAA